MDHSDAQVKGIPRFLPDNLSTSLLLSSVGIPSGLYISAPESVLSLLPSQETTSAPLILLSFCLGLSVLILLFLAAHLMMVINHTKHRVIRHYTAHPESMDIKNLVKKLSLIHYIFLLIIFSTGVLVGHYL